MRSRDGRGDSIGGFGTSMVVGRWSGGEVEEVEKTDLEGGLDTQGRRRGTGRRRRAA